jgi:Xaa-Pro dipeptidase
MTEQSYNERAFPEPEYRERLARLRRTLVERGLDALLLHAPEDINYLSGFNSCGYYSYQHMLVGADDSVHALLTRLVEIGIARATCIPLEKEYWSDRDDYVAMTADMIAAKGLSSARIGLQESALYLKLAEFRRLERLLPKVSFVDASDIVARLRLVKSQREIGSVRRAAAITDAALRAGLEATVEGARECDVAGAAYAAMFREGGEPPAYPGTFTSGPRTCFLHGMATERRLDKGDLIVMEPMGCYNRYNTNAIRTAVIGAPSAKAKDAYDLMVESVEACTAMVKPGILAEEIDRLSRKITGRYAGNRLHRTGYSLEIGYPPGFVGAVNLLEGDKTPLEAGMVISIEPNTTFYDEGWGVQLGNCVLVTETGHETLHLTPLEMAVR